MDEQTRQRIAAVRHLSVLADALEQGKTLQFLVDKHGWADVASLPRNIGNDDIITHWRVKPGKKYRPWRKDEVPAYFMARWKGGPVEVGNSLLDSWCDERARRLFDSAVRVLEDGSEVPCGVEVNE